jgi:rhodanese-related sulfurtransferase
MRRRVFLNLLAAALLCATAAGAGAQAPPDRIPLAEFKALLVGGEPVAILDVRHEAETKIKGAKHIPLDALDARTGELPRDREIITYCA